MLAPPALEWLRRNGVRLARAESHPRPRLHVGVVGHAPHVPPLLQDHGS